MSFNHEQMHAQFMKTFRMNYEKSCSSSSSDDDNDLDLDHQGYKKCSGCTGWDHQLINCTSCQRCYHKNCHIPQLPATMAFSDLLSYKSWICTMCIDIDHISKVMLEKDCVPNERFLDSNEMIIASRILLELICDEKNSFQFMELPFKYSDPHYYQVVRNPVSLNTVKERLSMNNYYKSFFEVLFDIKQIYTNNLVYYAKDDPYHMMAKKQEYLLFQMLNKWVPQY